MHVVHTRQRRMNIFSDTRLYALMARLHNHAHYTERGIVTTHLLPSGCLKRGIASASSDQTSAVMLSPASALMKASCQNVISLCCPLVLWAWSFVHTEPIHGAGKKLLGIADFQSDGPNINRCQHRQLDMCWERLPESRKRRTAGKNRPGSWAACHRCVPPRQLKKQRGIVVCDGSRLKKKEVSFFFSGKRSPATYRLY